MNSSLKKETKVKKSAIEGILNVHGLNVFCLFSQMSVKWKLLVRSYFSFLVVVVVVVVVVVATLKGSRNRKRETRCCPSAKATAAQIIQQYERNQFIKESQWIQSQMNFEGPPGDDPARHHTKNPLGRILGGISPEGRWDTTKKWRKRRWRWRGEGSGGQFPQNREKKEEKKDIKWAELQESAVLFEIARSSKLLKNSQILNHRRHIELINNNWKRTKGSFLSQQ